MAVTLTYHVNLEQAPIWLSSTMQQQMHGQSPELADVSSLK